MTLNLNIPTSEPTLTPKMTVIGVGGAGGNAVNNMIDAELDGVDFLVANTDAQALTQSRCAQTIQLGREITKGLGAGSNPEIGKAAAEESIDEISQQLSGTNMVFITAGMGGGTGTGAAPIIARTARDADILTVGVVVKPFHFEGAPRLRQADAGIEELSKHVDTLIIIPNQNLFRIANENTTFADAFKTSDSVLLEGIKSITDLIVKPGQVNLDFADLRAVMKKMGKTMMGTGESSGEGRALEAATAAISNPLLEEISMKSARSVLVNVTGGLDITLHEIDAGMNRIRDEVDLETEIFWGSCIDPDMDGTVRISVVATGIDAEKSTQPVEPESTRAETVQRGEQVPKPAPAEHESPRTTGEAARVSSAPHAISDVLNDARPTEQQNHPARDVVSPATEPAPTVDKSNALGGFDTPETMIAKQTQAPAPRTTAPAPHTAVPASQTAVAAPHMADSFTESDLTNSDEKKSLFGRLSHKATHVLQAATKSPERQSEPVLDLPHKPARNKIEDQGLFDPEPTNTTDEDLLDIPAFLRRQAN